MRVRAPSHNPHSAARVAARAVRIHAGGGVNATAAAREAAKAARAKEVAAAKAAAMAMMAPATAAAREAAEREAASRRGHKCVVDDQAEQDPGPVAGSHGRASGLRLCRRARGPGRWCSKTPGCAGSAQLPAREH